MTDFSEFSSLKEQCLYFLIFLRLRLKVLIHHCFPKSRAWKLRLQLLKNRKACFTSPTWPIWALSLLILGYSKRPRIALITVRHVGCNVTIFRMKARPRVLKQSWRSRWVLRLLQSFGTAIWWTYRCSLKKEPSRWAKFTLMTTMKESIYNRTGTQKSQYNTNRLS